MSGLRNDGAGGRPDPVRELFSQAIDIPRDAWPAFLDAHCGRDAGLRAGVERLLAHHDAPADDFLESPAATLRPEPVDAWAGGLVGRTVGQYTLQRVIAVGGMGCVFEARQQRPDRLVAVKLLSPGRSATSALARFRLEPELLGRLRHPNIAQVFESGIHEGELGPVPYFAMELIPQARPIVDYATMNRLDTPGRLRLFTQVCDGVHHGHQKGVIHRDLKPANILVGADGMPKIIDFGVARATDADLVLTTRCTHVGDLVGTIRYMSPEQCDGDPAKIDTRSDVYSLGMVLYELLTGRLPYETAHSNALAALRVIKEASPVPPGGHDRGLRGDLDAIILKALEKNPAQRFQSAADLGQDIRRHLAREPIEARPPGRWVRLTRWVARRPILSTTILCAAILALTAMATLGSLWHAWRSYWRADHLRYESDALTTLLVTASGVELWRWLNTDESFLSFISRPEELGGGRLALIPFLRSGSGKNDAVLCAYNIDDSFERAIWSRRMVDEDLNEYCRLRRFSPRSFNPLICGVHDIFPTVPGEEIVICFQNTPNSQCLIRIYDLAGTPRYQVWQDGGVREAYWIREPGVLVFAGINGVVPFEKRLDPDFEGIPPPKLGAAHPPVVFGIKPELGVLESRWLASSPTAPAPRVEWLRCAWPPSLTMGDWRRFRLGPPFNGTPGSTVAVALEDIRTRISVEWELDAHGAIVPGTFRPSDSFGRVQNLPDPSVFDLRPLPPVRGVSEEPRVTPIDVAGAPISVP